VCDKGLNNFYGINKNNILKFLIFQIIYINYFIKGTYLFSNGDKYVGDITNNLFNGQGNILIK